MPSVIMENIFKAKVLWKNLTELLITFIGSV